ncbi:MAG: hypothetical protein K2N93_06080 [Alistipes sp.]|nr:hypothetical protein [Alistipes sp.]
MRRLIVPFVALAALVACHDGPFGDEGREVEPPPATTDIRSLQELLAGASVTVEGDIVVAGTVTADDRSGNFYHSLLIEDDGAGIELLAAVDRLHNDFPVGCRVTLRLRGLALGTTLGVLQAGAPPAAGSRYPTGYLPSRPALDAALVRHGQSTATVEPARLSLDALTRERCGTLVRIDGVRYEPEELESAAWSGYKRFVDDRGRTIHTYVSPYADFADGEPPVGLCTLRGILQYEASGDRYLIKLRDATDCSEN